MAKWKMDMDRVPRVWAEPYIIELFLNDSQGVYAVWRWFAAGRVIIECFESEQDLSREGIVLEEREDLIEKVVAAVKEVIEREIVTRELEFTAEIVVNDPNLFEELRKMYAELAELYPPE